MRQIEEVSINAAGTINSLVDFGTAQARGCVVSIAQNLTDPVRITSGPSGSECLHFQGRAVSLLGGSQEFGGPIMGPKVQIEWQGTVDFKRGVVRFFDEPIPPFGWAWLQFWSELAIAPAATGLDHSVNDWGGWVRSCGLVQRCTQNATVQLDPTVPLGLGTYGQVMQPLANRWELSELALPGAGTLVRARNDGAANMDWFCNVFGRCAA